MSAEIDTQEILKRLKALEEENAKLRRASIANVTKPLTLTESSYNGYPTLVFEGSFKPFTLGMKKLTVLKEAWPQVVLFLERQAKSTTDKVLPGFDEVKI